jgi:hypothetical protein
MEGDTMASDANRQAMAQIRAAFESGDLGAMAKAVTELGTEDVVQHWPQSGERISGRDRIIALLNAYP